MPQWALNGARAGLVEVNEEDGSARFANSILQAFLTARALLRCDRAGIDLWKRAIGQSAPTQNLDALVFFCAAPGDPSQAQRNRQEEVLETLLESLDVARMGGTVFSLLAAGAVVAGLLR